jgi:hypothetical protein
MADLSSILGGMVQGFKDFGTGLVDMFGTGGAAIGDAIASIQSGRATTKNQDDFRKWLYNTDSTKDAAAKGLGTILNGVSTVADVIPGAQAVTANPLFNGIQGAIGGVSDELKMAGENADLGRAAQRAGVGAASGLASGYAGQALGKTGNKLLSNGLTRGAVSGALGGGIANAGYTGIEGGSVQDMINAGLYGAQTGALVGGTTGLARELIKPTHKMDVALTDDEKAARIANIDDQLGKLDLNTPEGNARYNELAQQRQQYSGNKRLYRGLGQEYDPNYPKNKLDTQGYESWTDNPELARQYGDNVYYIDVPEGDIKTSYLDENPMSETYGDRNPIYSIDKKAGLNGVSGNEYLLSVDDPYKEGLTYNRLGSKPKTVADLMNEPKQKTVADLMLSPEQKEFFKDSKIRDENGNLKKMYHGSSDGTFTKFKEGSFFTDDKDYADTYQDEYAGMNYAGKKLVNPKTYEIYLDVKKPFSMADPEARRIIENEYIGRDKNHWVTDPSDTTEVDFTEADVLREWLKKNHPEYDGMYVNEGGGDDPFAEEGWEEWRGNSVVPFNANQIKDVNNLKPTADADIMYSKVAEGQLGLFDQPMPKTEPEPVALPKSQGEQASLFDQPKRPIVEAQTVDTEPVNPYAPVDGQTTQAMRDRAAEVLKNYAKKGVPDNELYNMIDESTLPAGYKEFREIVDSGKSYAKEKLGAENVNKADLRRVVEYLYDDTAKQEEMLRNVKIEESNDAARRAMYGLAPKKSGSSFSEKMLRRAADEKLTKEFTEKVGNIENRVPELMNSLRRYNPSDLSVRKGLTAAADELYSERLGIAPGNTIKYNGPADVRNAYGRYSKQSKNLALTRSNVSDPEQAISTVAHERLHSFQNEADLNRGKYGATNRYDKRVTDAFDDLRKDLEEAKVYKSYPETAERYGSKDAEYFYNTKEQEARMLQQYLNNKGYADLAELKRPNTGKSRSGEFGTEVNAAFDKFFDKLRALSKKGVALPALSALFGGGAIMAATQSDDKKKKSEVK